MVEDFSWVSDPQDDFRKYAVGLPETEIDSILGSIPSGWNYPPISHRRFVEWLVDDIKPEVTVELGVDYGYSSFILALCQDNPVYGIDCFDTSVHAGRIDEDYEFVLAIKDKLKIDNLEIIKGYFDEVAKAWDKEIDLLHIDGLHDYDNCKNDYETWSPLVKENGVILFHDTVSNPDGAGKFFNEVNLPKINFPNSFGLGVASKNGDIIQKIYETFHEPPEPESTEPKTIKIDEFA